MSRKKLVAKKLSELAELYGWGFQRKIAESIEGVTLNQVKAVFAERVANETIVNKVFAKAVQLCEEKLKEDQKATSEITDIISQTEFVKEKILPNSDNNLNNISNSDDVVKSHFF